MFPSCPIDSRCYLPSASAIYFLMRGDECLYVGQSINLRNRWNAHEKLAEVGEGESLRLAWQPTPERHLDAVERKMISVLKPRYNYNLMPRTPKVPCVAYSMRMATLTTSEAAERLGVTRWRVNALITSGRLKAEKKGQIYLIDERDLKAVMVRTPGRPPKAKKGGKQ